MEEQKKSVVIDGVEYVPKVEGLDKDWPKHGDKYWFVASDNNKDSDIFSINSIYHDNRKKAGNCFRTEREAAFEALRRKCMATRWVPKEGDNMFVPDGRGGAFRDSIRYSLGAMLGLAAPTREEAQARFEKYGAAWMDVLKTKK